MHFRTGIPADVEIPAPVTRTIREDVATWDAMRSILAIVWFPWDDFALCRLEMGGRRA